MYFYAHAKPAFINLIAIRSSDLSLAEDFYNHLGVFFDRKRHGEGPEHLCGGGGFGPLLEIYPLAEDQFPTTSVRLVISIDDVDAYMDGMARLGAEIIENPHDTEWGRRAVVKDLDGHMIELVTPQGRES